MNACPFADAPSFLDPEIQRAPFEFYRRLRSEAPVYWDAKVGCFVVSRQETIQAICRDTEVFSNLGCTAAPVKSRVADEVAAIRARTYPSVPMLATNDPPTHTAYRAQSNKLLSQKRMRAMETFARERITALLEPMLRNGGGEFVKEFAVPLPVAVIGKLVGVPEAMWPKIKAWTDAIFEPLSGMISEEREIECAHLFVERQTYFANWVERVRREGGPDELLTDIALLRDADGAYWGLPEALALIEQYFAAGNETTTSMLTMGALTLAQQPSLAERIDEDDTKLATFVEEMLRLYGPVQGQFRAVMRDTEVEGVRIPRGSRVMIRFGAANRQESAFPHADEIDLERQNSRLHLSFGYGIHTCQGATLARLELLAAFRALMRDVADLRLASRPDAFRHAQAITFMGLAELHLQMRPRVH